MSNSGASPEATKLAEAQRLLALGNLVMAEAVANDLISNYPNTQEATDAQAVLAQIPAAREAQQRAKAGAGGEQAGANYVETAAGSGVFYPTTADGCLLTEYGNFIGCYDTGFDSCDQEPFNCGATSLTGEDEILIIESGNPDRIRSGGYGPQTSGAVKEVTADPADREGPTDGTWGTGRSGKQNGVLYKEHVVRRDLVHGSHEEHIYGDKHTTIEGTWFAVVKGHLWNTYYAKVQDDFNELYRSVNYDEVKTWNYGDVTSRYGKEDEPIDITEEYYIGTMTQTTLGDTIESEFGAEGDEIEITETYHVGTHKEEVHGHKHEVHYGTKLEEVWEGAETQLNGGALNSVCLGEEGTLNVGAKIDILIGLLLDVHSGINVEVHNALKFEACKAVKLEDTDVHLFSTKAKVASVALSAVFGKLTLYGG